MKQLDVFDLLYEDYKLPKDRPIRIVEAFSGIGTQKMAFNKLSLDHEVVAIIEVDKFALLSYASIHTDYLKIRETYFKENEVCKIEMVDLLQNRNIGFNFVNGTHSIKHGLDIEKVRDYYLATILTNNLGDISKVKAEHLPKVIDVFTYSFPCTDLSKAGTQKGLNETRSGLVYEVFRIVEELQEIDNKPKTLIMENVVDLVQKKFIKEFHEMQNEVESFGYTNYTLRMNSKDYGVAQNRERVFMVSIMGEYNFQTPKPFPLEKKLKDYLEDVVNESFYLSDKMLNFFIANSKKNQEKGNGFRFKPKDIDTEDVANALTTLAGNRMDDNFISIPEDLRIRKLTPRECYRLMGIKDKDFDKAQSVTSNSQLYKQAGNAIVVDVFANLIKGMI